MSDTKSAPDDSQTATEVDDHGPATAETPAAASLRVAIVRGEPFGRYTVRDRIGAGGMGEVFSAHDPELDRVVAVKILRRDVGGSTSEARARFQREAQAMARLNHPNVVSIYEVGTHGTHVFVAMELVEGPTMAGWLKEQPRPWREVVQVFLQAGRGLEAAHAAGIVHRDFKPSNVILGNRVRVADFGLARAAHDPEDLEMTPGGSVLETDVTQTGRAVGTPAYMAPEQRAALTATPLSDQYSFGLALREALSRSTTTVPAWLRAVSARAQKLRPEDRYPSMAALLRDLGRDPDRNRRRAIAAGAIVVVAAAAVIAREEVRGSPCKLPEVASLWDDATRAKAKAAFLKSGRSYAADTFERVDAAVGPQLSRWAEAHREACMATERHEQSAALLDLRMRCLAHTRDDAATIIGLLAEADERAVDRAVVAVTGLADPAPCADLDALTSVVPSPHDPARLKEENAVLLETGRILALGNVGRGKDALAAAHALVPRAEALGNTPGRAVALRAAAVIEGDAGRPEDVIPLAHSALRAAEEAHDDVNSADVLALLYFVLGNRMHRFGEAEALAPAVEAAVARAGSPPRLMAALQHRMGSVIQTKGDVVRALPHFVAELGHAIRQSGWKSRNVTLALQDISSAEDDLEAYQASKDTLSVSIHVLESLVGPDHPWLASALHNQGYTAVALGEYEDAAASYSRAITIIERAYGADSERMGNALQGLARAQSGLKKYQEAMVTAERAGVILAKGNPEAPLAIVNLDIKAEIAMEMGDYAKAQGFAEQALAIHLKVHGVDFGDTGRTQYMLGIILADQGKDAEAEPHLRQAAAILTKMVGAEIRDTLDAEVHLAHVLAKEGKAKQGAAQCDRELPIAEKILEPSSALMVGTLATCADVYLEAGMVARARMLAEQADTASNAQGIDDDARAQARAIHAQTLFVVDRPRACALAHEAAALAASHPPVLAELERGLSRGHCGKRP